MKEKLKKISLKQWHIVLIIIGIIFISIGAFHGNTWFDESYSVGMARQTFADIWNFGGHDVHPILYYWALRIINLIFGESVILYRIFSVIPIAIMMILGFTHIRKDFGEKTGIIFTFICAFLPEMITYAIEVRMYSWAILAVTVCALYAYRLSKEDNLKNWIIFGISSLASIYLHYYGLMAAGLINVFLLIYLIIKKRKKGLIFIITFGLVQLVAYLPWMFFLASQLKTVSGGFWIGFEFPKTLMELLSAQIAGYIRTTDYQELLVPTVISVELYAYLIYKSIKLFMKKEKMKPFILSVVLYFSVIIAAIIITIFMHTSILYYRYLFVITGFYIFAISFILAKEESKAMRRAILIIIALFGIYNNVGMIADNYSNTNNGPIQYMKQNISEDDSIVFVDIGVGSVAANTCHDTNVYFLNEANWGVVEAYKVFGPNYETLIDKVELMNKTDKSNKIWVVDYLDGSAADDIYGDEDNYKKVSEEKFFTEYHDYKWKITLIEKVK